MVALPATLGAVCAKDADAAKSSKAAASLRAAFCNQGLRSIVGLAPEMRCLLLYQDPFAVDQLDRDLLRGFPALHLGHDDHLRLVAVLIHGNDLGAGLEHGGEEVQH